MANTDPFYGMTPIQKIKAIKAKPELNLQNPYGLTGGLGAVPTATTALVAPVVTTPISDKFSRDFGNAPTLPNGNVSGGQLEIPKTNETKSYLGAAWDGTKDFFGVTPDAPKQTFGDYSAGGGTMTEKEFKTDQFDQDRLAGQQFNNYAGLGLGVAQLGMSAFSTFGSNGSLAMNKKNMQLMDGQIANNNDIMATRKARASDIQKYFG